MITHPQALVVTYIKENPYCDIEEIVEGLGVKKNAVSRMLHTLEDNEIIEFTHDPYSFGSHNSQGGASFNHSGWIIAQQNASVSKTEEV